MLILSASIVSLVTRYVFLGFILYYRIYKLRISCSIFCVIDCAMLHMLMQAHFIKDRTSNTARAIFALISHYKWALSGTPLQNRVGELYSLVCLPEIFFCLPIFLYTAG